MQGLSTPTRSERLRLQYLRRKNRTATQEIMQSQDAHTHALTIREITYQDGTDRCGRPILKKRAEVIEAVPRSRKPAKSGGSPIQTIRRREAKWEVRPGYTSE